ncbi:MAG: FAD-dependent oxidoreductase, partial [Eubacteriales bacterium]
LQNIYALGGSLSELAQMYNEEIMKLALDRMIREYNIKVLFHALLSDVDFAGGAVRSVTVSTVSGNIKITCPVYIDATGNADLTAFAGLPYKLGREEDGLCQPMTLCFRLTNVDWARYDHKAANELYKKMQSEGKLINPREDILVFRHPIPNIMHLNTTRIFGKNPVDIEDVSQAEMDVREQVYEMLHFMRENIAGMENCDLVSSAAEIGVRESRRIVGRYEITTDDIVNVTKFDDRIARGTYEIDIHNPAGSGTYHKAVPDHDYYTIPYRAMLPASADNIIVAGRPLSSSHEAHASFRIMPITSCIGEAAGIAASLAVDSDCPAQEIDIKKLQDTLTDRGALV